MTFSRTYIFFFFVVMCGEQYEQRGKELLPAVSRIIPWLLEEHTHAPSVTMDRQNKFKALAITNQNNIAVQKEADIQK